MHRLKLLSLLPLLVLSASLPAAEPAAPSAPAPAPAPAATAPLDPSLTEFVQGFKGKGRMSDGSKPLTPEEALRHFKVAPGLQMELVASEPTITQPLNIYFDERGRLWLVQYIQYPFPAGLKVLKYDQYLRAVFDKVPPPPPHHFKGLDKITILEDKRGDGTFEFKKDFLSDLNIARSVVVGRGGVWVLNPPYLLFYPDRNRDDIPDADPEVCLSGFGLEDTHSGANSLAWGPDGWLYGAHGSTCTADVKGVKFLGQAIWRYQPETKVFEVFAEGGGNTYNLEFDAEGRAFAGTNGANTARGMYYSQGSAGVKNWSKHGPLMNPYSFGFFEHMAHKQTVQLTHVGQPFIIYEGGAFPERFNGCLLTGIPLSNLMERSTLTPDGSTFQTEDVEALATTDDHWFRPVDTKLGPDGAVYIADWCDSRLSHVDPHDTWDKDHGRIYRLRVPGAPPVKPFDLGALSSLELTKYFTHPNKWFRQTALRVLYDRRDASLIPVLKRTVQENAGQVALEAFWALNASGGFTDEVALETLEHPNPMVRYWTVRLLGDRYMPALYSSSTVEPPPLPAAIRAKLTAQATREPDVRVRSQIASAAKRFLGPDALPILRELLYHSEDAADKQVPLLIWWALESKAVSDRDAVLALFKDSALWQAPLVSQSIVSRLGQRYTAERTPENLQTASQLLAMAPSPQATDELIKGMELGLQGDRVTAVPETLQKEVGAVWSSRPHTPTLMSFALRLNYEPAAAEAVQMLGDPKTSPADRKPLLALLSERGVEAAAPVMINLLKAEPKESNQITLLEALARFNSPEIGQTMLALFPKASTKVRATLISSLTRRADWARPLLEEVDRGKIKREALTPGNVFAIQNLGDAGADKLVKKLWGNVRQSSEAKEQKITNVRKLLASGKGSPEEGKKLFTGRCAVCHTLNGEGAKIGPDLTGYERDNLDFMLPSIIDPSLAIREEYIAFNVTTKQGQSLVGFMVENDPKVVAIKDLTGNVVKLAREDVTSLNGLTTSIMPEGLLDTMTDAEIRDLFAYLTKKQ